MRGKYEIEPGHHAHYIIPCLVNVLRAEDNPSDNNQQEGDKHLAYLFYIRKQAALGYHVFVLAILAHDEQRQEQQSVKSSPADESPVGSVPKAADQEYNQCVAHRFPFAASASAQRNVNIIAEPGCERYVPAPPELGYIP